MTLTKTEIRWMLASVKESRESSKVLKDLPGQQFAALHALEFENMTTLAAKLETLLDTNAKRVSIG